MSRNAEVDRSSEGLEIDIAAFVPYLRGARHNEILRGPYPEIVVADCAGGAASIDAASKEPRIRPEDDAVARTANSRYGPSLATARNSSAVALGNPKKSR